MNHKEPLSKEEKREAKETVRRKMEERKERKKVQAAEQAAAKKIEKQANLSKIKDIYTTDIVSIKDEKPLMQSSSSGPKVVFIPYDDPPVAMSPIRPIYPEIAQKVGIEGVVVVQAYIDERGRVKETLILKGVPNTGLDEAAMASIRKTRFKPAKQKGKDVSVWISIPVYFGLK